MRIIAFALALAACGLCRAESRALIVVGTTGDEADAENFSRLASKTNAALIQRGIPAANIMVLSEKVTREEMLAALTEAGSKVNPEDDFWFVIFGHGGRTQDGLPAFQVRGPRVTADDLKNSLSGIHAKKFVFFATESSGGFLPFLKMPDCVALAATAEQGEINQPRFPEQWVQALTEKPKATFAEIAARGAQLVEAQYQSLGLVQGEHGRMLAPGSGEILEPPFGVSDRATATTKNTDIASASGISAKEIEIPKAAANSDFELKPATDETRKMIAEAKAVENPDHHAAIMLRQTLTFTVNSDRSTAETSRLRVYLAREEALEAWANYSFYQEPPVSVTTVEGARIILPDATSLVLNPARLTSAPGNREIGLPSATNVLFPQAQAGAIVEIVTRTERHAQTQQPEFYQELELQRTIPVLQSTVTLNLPKAQKFHHILKNIEAPPETSETEHSKVLTWNFTKLAAFEPLPLDPPRRDLVAWLGISSLDSWDGFIDWFHRVSSKSGETSAAVKQKGAEIAAANKTREEKTKAAFEFVSSLRYIAIEFGIHAFRPRTPEAVLYQRYGDCKDKANLLVALLRSMEIPANFVLINRGASTDPAFPGWQFNHAIAFVPGATEKSGNLWLDSTDTTTPFGTIAPGNLGRSALVFEGKGASFKTVTNATVTTIRDEWTFDQDASGKVRGQLDQKWTGLADYGKRQELGSLTPLQRRFVLTQHLSEMLPWADYSQIVTSDPKDLKLPMSLHCMVETAVNARPVASLKWIDAFAPLERDRPLEINDGQPVRYEQVVRWTSVKAPTKPADFVREVAGEKLTIRHQADAQTVTRTATCEINQPRISPKDYPAVRAALREWSRQIERDSP